MAPIIQINNVYKNFGSVEALRGVSLNVEKGEVVVRAKNGIGAVVFLPSGKEVAGDEIHKAFWSEGLKDRPKVKRYSLAEIAKHAGKLKRFRMIVMDGDGNQTESDDTAAFPEAK